jgi:hypothetical protein
LEFAVTRLFPDWASANFQIFNSRWSLALKHNFFAFFPDRYILTVTMIFGAMVAGATSEGGGAVAFPVMTLALGIRDQIHNSSLSLQLTNALNKLDCLSFSAFLA